MYDLDSTRAVEHVVGDLESFYIHGVYYNASLLTEETASEAGVIRFTTPGGGALQITQGDYVNQPPAARAGEDQTVEDSDGDGQETVALDGTDSFDVDGSITAYEWRANGMTIATGVSPSVTLPVGNHEIDLTVTDGEGATGQDRVTAIVSATGDVVGEDDAVQPGGAAGKLSASCACRSTSVAPLGWMLLVALVGSWRRRLRSR